MNNQRASSLSKCPQCKNTLPPAALYCPVCGTVIRKSEARSNSSNGEFELKTKDEEVKPSIRKTVILVLGWFIGSFVASIGGGFIGAWLFQSDIICATTAMWNTFLIGIIVNWHKPRIRNGIFLSAIGLFLVSLFASMGEQAALKSNPSPSPEPTITVTRVIVRPTITPFVPTPTSEYSFCPKTSVRVRSGPGTNYNMLDGLAVNECYQVKGRNVNSTWLYLGNGGWVVADPAIIIVYSSDISRLPVYPAP